jgi:protease-4
MVRTGKNTWKVLTIIFFFTAVGIMFTVGLALFASWQSGSNGNFILNSSKNSDKIALVRIEEVILSSANVVGQIEHWADNKDIKAIIIRIVSPGGGVAQSQEIFHAILLAKKKKPIVASMGTVAASGGYYIASATDKIIAVPGTITGSIGVITQFTNMEKLFDTIGMSSIVFKSGKYKDAGSPFRPFTEEDHKLMQGIIDDVYNQFIEDVANSRNMELEKVRKLADGRIFTGRQALSNGLIDELGTFRDSVKAATEMAGIGNDPEIVEVDKKSNFLEWLLAELDIAIPAKVFTPPGIYYLWAAW